MAWNEPQVPTRSSRNQKNRMNRILNWSIGIVCVAILIIGGYLLYQVIQPSGKTASQSKTTHTKVSATKTTGAESSQTSGTSKSSNGSTNNSTSTVSGNGSTPSSKASNTDTSGGSASGSVSNTNAAYHFVGGGINGPWSPIGTVQNEPHQTSYTEGGIDWNEQIKALLYATNINDNDYIVWWLGNGGVPNTSKATISTKEAPNKKYEVMLKWVTNQGWEPTSVTLQSASNSNASSSASDSGTSASSGTSSNSSSSSKP